jgi:hypothetical protein
VQSVVHPVDQDLSACADHIHPRSWGGAGAFEFMLQPRDVGVLLSDCILYGDLTRTRIYSNGTCQSRLHSKFSRGLLRL